MDKPAMAPALPEAQPEAAQPEEEVPPSQQYWAAEKDSEEFGKKLQSRLDVCREAAKTSTHLRNVATAYTHYYGQDIEGVGATATEIVRSGEQGEMAELRVPKCRALVAGVVNIVTGAKVAWEAVSSNADHDSRSACVTLDNALEYYWKERGVLKRGVDATRDAVVFGEGFILTPWNEAKGNPVAAYNGKLVHDGDIDFRLVKTWDVIRDPTYKAWEELPWYAFVLWENKFDVAADAPPDKREDVLSRSAATLSTRVYGAQAGAMEPDCIQVIHFVHKPTPALQQGRYSRMLEGGLVLEDGPLPEEYWEGGPLHRIASGELAGTPWPYASFWAALGVAQVADSIHTSLATNITTTAPGLISAEKDSELAPNDIAGGPKVIYRRAGSQPPVAVQLQQASGEQFKYLDLLRKEEQGMVGLNSTTMGEPEAKTLSGAAMALLSSMSIQANSDLQGNWVDFVTRLGNCFLRVFQKRATVERKVALAGKNRAGLVKALHLSSSSIAGVERVTADIGNPMQQTVAGRMELAQLYLQIPGMVQVPEQIQSVVDTGRLEPLTQNLSNELLLISGENEALADGKEAPVMLTDNHRLHLKEHPGVGATVEARANPEVMQALQAHIAQHIKLLRETDPGILMALGQQPLPPPQPPAGMGPPGAPPGMPPGAPPGPGGPPGATAGPPPSADAAMPPMPAPGGPGGEPPDMPHMPTNPATGEKFAPAAGVAPGGPIG
jgi:hypothetical protein